MCGICGYGSIERNPEHLWELRAMNEALFHRGPDDSGELVKGKVGIAMRRLAVIDVGGGAQPIASLDEKVWVVLNGEIYNFRELRGSLETSGYHFKTQSDTEVVLAAYLQYGKEMVSRLAGMFAFAILDTRNGEELFIGRDRFGEKPLFYSLVQGTLVFSSELRSLLQWSAVRPRLDWTSLGYFLRFSCVPSPMTMFRDVYQLSPGHILTWREGAITTDPYFEVRYDCDPSLEDEERASEAVEEGLRRAVARQTYADVPTGAFLSGGIDSSLVVSYLAEVLDEPVRSFTARFEQSSFDEGLIASEVAEKVGTRHHEILIKDEGFKLEDLHRIIDHVGQPLTDSSAIPTYHLSAGTRRSVTVAFSGDGGDELFAGYNVLRWLQQASRLDWFSRPLARAAARFTGWLGNKTYFDRIAALRKVRNGLELVGTSPERRFWLLHSFFTPTELDQLLTPEALKRSEVDETDNLLVALPEDARRWSPLRQAMYYRLTRNLPLGMLVKVDRMSMACSLETRLPMLDPELAELSFRLPDRHLIRNGEGKHILRTIASRRLPASVTRHPKSGFDIPLHTFQNEQYVEVARDTLLGDELLGLGFKQETLEGILATGTHQKKDSARRSLYRTNNDLWGLIQLGTWLRRFSVEIS